MKDKTPLLGAAWMLMAGLCFAVVNSFAQYVSFKMHLPSTTVAFVQYLIAFLMMLPWLKKLGIRKTLKTDHFAWHCLRVFFSVIGIQLWMWALAYPVPIWQGIALLMISPLFATLGSGLFLGERVSAARWIATLSGFMGAMIILEPWSDDFMLASLLPVGAAFFWALYSLMVKKVSYHDSPATIVVYLFLLITPFNLFLALPKWSMPQGDTVWLLLIGAGIFTALAQWGIAKAYSLADASFIQTFDHAKLPLNVLFGFLVFGWVPPGRLWLGGAIIIGSIFFISHWETRKLPPEKTQPPKKSD